MQLLYGKLWSDEDAKYAKELELDMRLTAPDLERLWRTNRPSVRKRCSEGAPAPTAKEPEKAPERSVSVPAPSEQPPAHANPFAGWLATCGLSVRDAAGFLGVSVGAVHNWKRKGAPPDIMAKLGSPGKGD